MKTYFYFHKKRIPVNILSTDDSWELSFNYNKALVEEIKESTDTRQWVAERRVWHLKKTPRNKFVLAFLQGKKPYARYDVPLVIPNIEGFWGHQNPMYAHIMQRKQVIIAGEMRTGKTRPTLRAIIDTQCYGAWWIAPKSALRGLKNELVKWGFPFKIFLMTYDKFRRTYNGSLAVVPKFIVFDECQRLKNPRSKQGQLAFDLATDQQIKYGNDRYIVLLSGTPAPKDPSDWWNITEVACAGFLREGSQTGLKQKLGEWEQKERENLEKQEEEEEEQEKKYYYKLTKWKEDEVKRFHKRLKGLVEVYFKKDCLDLPQKIYNIIKLDIPSEYKMAINLIKGTESKAITLLNKLRQLSDGFQYINTPDSITAINKRETKYFPNCPKDNQLKLDLDEFEDIGRVIVYCGFQATLDKITSICIKEGWAVLKVDGRGWEALNTTATVDECLKEMDGSLNVGKIEKLAFCAQADAASEGLELSASPIIIYYSNSFSGRARMQSEDRPHSNNMDKSRGLEIRDYIHLPTDELTRLNLKEKKTLQSITMGDINLSMKGVWND